MEETGKIIQLRVINNLLSVAVIGLSIYIFLIPLLPNLEFWWRKSVEKTSPLITAIEESGSSESSAATKPAENTLVIPSLRLEERIYEGSDSSVLNQGIWLRPNTVAPNVTGNSVIVGHRFTYSDPSGPFYHLDKVKVDDKIVVYWQGERYDYRVRETLVVDSDATQIEEPTDSPVLTIYTCTPLWSAKDRLVVIAVPEEGQP